MKKYTEKKAANSSGYTLIETAISLLIVGLIVGAGVALYGQYIKQASVDKTLSNIDTASVKLESFQREEGRLPCPAPLNVARTAPAYGAENPASCLAAIAAGAGTCTNGICVEQTVRTDLTATPTEGFVLVGALPFRTLQIPEDSTFDGYKSRLVYAVTYSATSDTTFNTHKGAISVRDSNNRPLTSQDGNALYLTLSPGENRMGAYSNLGSLVNACGAGTQESENCNVGFETGTAISPLSIYKSTLHSTGANAQYFDDYVLYYAKSSDPTWRRTTANIDNIQDLSPRFIGIGGATTASQTMEITSSGTIDSLRVYGTNGTNGEVRTNEVCDENGANCFNPLVIAGDNAAGQGMKCPPFTYMSQIRNGAPDCIPAVEILCPDSAPVLKGVNTTTGAPICGTIPVVNCPATTITACPGSSNPQTFHLPAGANTNTVDKTATIAGECRKIVYICNGTSWVEKTTGSPKTTGNCTTPVAPAPTPVACGSVPGLNAFPSGWAGNALRKTVINACGVSTVTYDVSACTCKVSTAPTPLTCLSPYSGTYAGSKKSECWGQPTDGLAPEPTDTKTTYTSPTYDPTVSLYAPVITTDTSNSTSCSCAATDAWEFANCPAGFTRSGSPSPASFTSPAASWPAASVKGQYRKKTIDTATCSASYSAYDSSNCTCDTSPTYSKAQTTCAASCSEPNNDPLTITGVAIPITKGDDVFKTVRDASAGCTSTTTNIHTGICRPKSFSWASIGVVGTYTAGNRPENKVGHGCNCDEHTSGLTYKCRVPGDASNTMYDCKCQ